MLRCHNIIVFFFYFYLEILATNEVNYHMYMYIHNHIIG